MSTPHKFHEESHRLFWYWINERHSIYLKRQAKKQWPWTEDEILRKYFFTNVFRQLDKVTIEWTKRYVRLEHPTPGDVLFHNILFRLFNLPETYDEIYFNMSWWNKEKATELLKARMAAGYKIFTGAYIVTASGRSEPKYEGIVAALEIASVNREKFAASIMREQSLRYAVNLLQDRLPTVGGFVGYEIACDLRFTSILNRSTDHLSWANDGPGAKRGMHYLLTGERRLPAGYGKVDYLSVMRQLYASRGKYLKKHVKDFTDWPFELREIEHSLCEFFKYVKAMEGDGSKRVYRPKNEEQLELDV